MAPWCWGVFPCLGILQIQSRRAKRANISLRLLRPRLISSKSSAVNPMAWAMPERFGVTTAGARVGRNRHAKPAKPFNGTTPRYIRLPGLNTWKAGTPLCVAPAA